jgi:hypothetical protein
LTVKASLIFGKRFTVFKTVNRFPKLYSLSLHARLISDCSNPAIIGRPKQGSTGIRHHPGGEIMPTDQILTKSGWNPAMVRNRPESDLIRPDLAKMAGIRPDMTGPGH